MTQPTWTPELVNQIESLTARHQIPGLALGVALNGSPVLAQGFGHRDVAGGLPVTPDTVFGVASVTKSVAALAIMLLEAEGRLSTADPVIRWLPDFRVPDPESTRAITIHHLLTHSSGLPGLKAIYHARAGSIRKDPNYRRLGVAYDPFQVEPIRTWGELITLMAETEYDLLGAPGQLFNYSNEGYALLQGIIEQASGRPFLDVVQERILDPLGMERSAFRTEELERFAEVTELYASAVEHGQKTVFHAPGWWDVGEIYTNGSLKSTVQDLLRYLEVYRCYGLVGGHRLAPEAVIRKMMHPHITMPTGRRYGYGLDVHPGYHGVTLIGHSGGIKGVSAHVLVAPEAGLTAAALTNIANVPAEEATLAAANAVLGLPLNTRKQTFPTFAMDPEQYAAYTGLYRSAEGGAARILLRDGIPCLETQGVTLPTRPFAEDGIVTMDGATPLRFLRRNGTVFALFMGSRILTKAS